MSSNKDLLKAKAKLDYHTSKGNLAKAYNWSMIYESLKTTLMRQTIGG